MHIPHHTSSESLAEASFQSQLMLANQLQTLQCSSFRIASRALSTMEDQEALCSSKLQNTFCKIQALGLL